MTKEMTNTYQTRLLLDQDRDQILQECACLLSKVERSLYAETAKGKSSAACKNDFLKKYQITARQFNACRISLEGKLSACRASQEQNLANLKHQMSALNRQIQALEKKPSKHFVLHQKRRRKSRLSHRLASLEEDVKQNRTSLCFGGKKLFHAQYHLEENRFASHTEWKKAWEAKRNSEFFILGSKDESCGNQTCQAALEEDGTLSLRLRLPKALEQSHGKYLQTRGLLFAYGQQQIVAALHQEQAISYRFKKDVKGWTVFVSTTLKKANPISIEGHGVIGIDLNADHIAYVETDACGNPITKRVLSWVTYGKTKEQLKALTGEVVKEIVERAIETSKPLVIEKLDFQKKKLSTIGHPSYSRMLSSFAYSLFFSFLTARAYKYGIEIHRVNPAFTSIIGCVNYAKRYGLSTHLAAALCIARRYQNFSEHPCSSIGDIPDGKGGHVTFVLPERNRTKHVWHFWSKVKKKIPTVLAAHKRAIRSHRSKGPP